MDGINLSSGTPEKKQETSRFSSGSLLIVLVFFLLLALWGGMQWYLKTLDGTLAENNGALEENSGRLRGDAVDRIVAFDARLTLAKKQMTESVDVENILGQLERLVIPNVRLTGYEFNKKEKFVIVKGETDTFKYVAEQLVSFKGESLFSGITVDSLKKTPEGRITFSFKAGLN